MKVLFFGTPDVAVPFLSWLTDHHQVVGVVCQPDKPVGRGYEIHAPPVKEYARKKNLPVFQPEGKWEESFLNQLRKTEADLGVAVAYGRLMPESLIQLPRLGTLNVHFSLLPKYRGAAPVQWALINGETETGVTLFWLEKALDSGPIFHQQKLMIDASDDAASLQDKLIPVGLEVLGQALEDLKEGNVLRTPQTGEPSFAPLLKKELAVLDWSKPASAIANLIRGISYWPVAIVGYDSMSGPKKLKIFKAQIIEGSSVSSKTGRVIEVSEKKGMVVQAGQGTVALQWVQPEGKKPMSAWAFWQGAHLKIGDQLK